MGGSSVDRHHPWDCVVPTRTPRNARNRDTKESEFPRWLQLYKLKPRTHHAGRITTRSSEFRMDRTFNWNLRFNFQTFLVYPKSGAPCLRQFWKLTQSPAPNPPPFQSLPTQPPKYGRSTSGLEGQRISQFSGQNCCQSRVDIRHV
jgi:hypothetical protein